MNLVPEPDSFDDDFALQVGKGRRRDRTASIEHLRSSVAYVRSFESRVHAPRVRELHDHRFVHVPVRGDHQMDVAIVLDGGGDDLGADLVDLFFGTNLSACPRGKRRLTYR